MHAESGRPGRCLDTWGGIVLAFRYPPGYIEPCVVPARSDCSRIRRAAPDDSDSRHPSRCTIGSTGGSRAPVLRAAWPVRAEEVEPERRSPFARLGAWAATHFRRVLIAWLLVLLVFGVFAVHVENALAGAGWQASDSQSVAARAVIEKDFAGLGATGLQVVIVDHNGPIASDPQAQAVVAKATSVLRSDPRVSTVVPPQAGVSISRDGRTAIITAGAAADSNTMVEAADAVEPKLAALSTSGVSVTLTGDSALWANFNNANRSAMLRSEMLSWPVTIIILVIAFGSLVAAGLPLLLTMAGLLVAAGALVITTKFTPVSIWALNFALMFALALGIDYALFLVMRFRSALERRGANPATARRSSPRWPRRSTPPARPSPSAPSPCSPLWRPS